MRSGTMMIASILEPGVSDSVLPGVDNQSSADTSRRHPRSSKESSRKRVEGKGKGKARAVENSDTFDHLKDHPEVSLDEEIGIEAPNSGANQLSSREPTPETGPHQRKRSRTDDLREQVDQHINTISQLKQDLHKTNSRVEVLERDLRAVCDIVDKYVGKRSNHVEDETLTGGRIAVCTALLVSLNQYT